MTIAKQPLADRVAGRCHVNSGFPPAVVDALRLAEMYDDIKPEEFSVPTSGTLEAYRPLNMNRMLYKAD